MGGDNLPRGLREQVEAHSDGASTAVCASGGVSGKQECLPHPGREESVEPVLSVAG